MIRRIVFVLTAFAAMTAALLAADVSGKWLAQVPGRQGGAAREVTFMFKADGATLTGSMADAQTGKLDIADGKVSGDTISFSVTTERGKRTYTGAVAGAEIKFKREGGQAAQEFTAKRAE